MQIGGWAKIYEPARRVFSQSTTYKYSNQVHLLLFMGLMATRKPTDMEDTLDSNPSKGLLPRA
jgi:hypothetical protein